MSGVRNATPPVGDKPPCGSGLRKGDTEGDG